MPPPNFAQRLESSKRRAAEEQKEDVGIGILPYEQATPQRG